MEGRIFHITNSPGYGLTERDTEMFVLQAIRVVVVFFIFHLIVLE